MTADKPLDERYFTWLYKKIGSVSNRNPARSHWYLAKRLYKTRFHYFVPNDDNRAMDGIDLREDFLDRHPSLPYDRDWMEMDCSMLEMLIALAIRAEYHTDEGMMPGGVGGWFWVFMDNIRLSKYTDDIMNEKSLEEIDRILEVVNERTYNENGRGGLFPLKKPKYNQLDVELWYQLTAYLMENQYVRIL